MELTIAILSLLILSSAVNANTLEYVAVPETVPIVQAISVPTPLPEAPKLPVDASNDIQALIVQIALQHSVDASLMRTIVRKESSYNPKAVGDTNYFCKRTQKTAPSRGLAQINECWWPDITREQMEDPYFAISFLAKHLKDGKCKQYWMTCPL